MYVIRRNHPWAALFLLPPLLLGGVFVTLAGWGAAGRRRRDDRLALVLLALALGFSCLYAGLRHRPAVVPYTGLPPDRVERFTFQLSADSSETASGMEMYRGRLLSVEGRDGTIATARGPAVVFAKGGPPAYQNSRLTVEGNLAESGEGDALVCFTERAKMRAVPAGPGGPPAIPAGLGDTLFHVRKTALLLLKARICRMEAGTNCPAASSRVSGRRGRVTCSRFRACTSVCFPPCSRSC